MTVYLSPSVSVIDNIDNLVNHQAFTTQKLEEVASHISPDMPYEDTHPFSMKLIAISEVALGILLSTIVGVFFGAKKGLLTLAVVSYPVFHEVKKCKAILAWRREAEAAGEELAKIYNEMTKYFVKEREKRETLIVHQMKFMPQSVAQKNAKLSYENVIQQAQKITELVNEKWDQYLPKQTRPIALCGMSDRSMLISDLSDWQELQNACKTFLKPSRLFFGNAVHEENDYVYIDKNEVCSFINWNKIPVE